MEMQYIVGGIAGLAVLGWGIYLMARAIQRAHFTEKERHIRRILELTEKEEL